MSMPSNPLTSVQESGVNLSTKQKNRRRKIKENKCNHHRGESRIGQNILIREGREIGAKGSASREPQHERDGNARDNVGQPAFSGRKPIMNHKQGHRENKSSDAEAH